MAHVSEGRNTGDYSKKRTIVMMELAGKAKKSKNSMSKVATLYVDN